MSANSNWPSFIKLREVLSNFFLDSEPAFVGEGHLTQWPRDEVANVVLFGDGLIALGSVLNWPSTKRYRLWALSTANACLIERTFDLPPQSVGVVPRYRLFPREKPEVQFDLTKQDFSLIVASRASEAKNFETTLKVMAAIQRSSRHKITCYVCGPMQEYDLNTQVRPMVDQIQWVTRPQILGDLGQNWFQFPFENPVLINLSTFIGEDFGVSVAQAQVGGWPLIVTKWGAHKDLLGRNLIFINPVLVLEDRVEDIVEQILSTGETSAPILTQSNSPKTFNFELLKQKAVGARPKLMQLLRYFQNSKIKLDPENAVFKLLTST